MTEPRTGRKPPSAPRAHRSAQARFELALPMIEAALAEQRIGGLSELVRRHPGATRWLLRRFMPLLRGAAGDALDVEQPLALAAELMLRWAVTQLRPDREPGLGAIDRRAWLDLTPWRPMLAVMCHAGLAPVPDFRDRYRRRPDEPVIDNLCGLWGVGPSTFYRHLERGKRAIAELLLREPIGLAHRFALRRFVQREIHARSRLDTAEAQARWHARQAERALAGHDVGAALWHWLAAGDAGGFLSVLRGMTLESAGHPETDALVERLAATALAPRRQAELWLARAALARTRNAPDRELNALEMALQVSRQAQDRLQMGVVYSALGKYHEPRDADRAFASYEESAEFLREADAREADAPVVEAYLTTLTRLAWLYVLRNDPRSKTVLERARQLGGSIRIPDDLLGMQEQAWGEYARRAGQLEAALEHKHRALTIFERIGDRRSTLATYLNLSSIYAETQRFDRAIDYAERILRAARDQMVEPEIVAGTHGNLGATYFLQGRHDAAIDQYRQALAVAGRSGLRQEATRAHYNLAEAYYKRFEIGHDPADAQLGSQHVDAVESAPMSASNPALLEAAKALRSEALRAAASTPTPDRLVAEEAAAHPPEAAEIQRQRAVLAVPMAPEAHVRARLAIANAYLAISVKEREAAQQLIERHGLAERFAGELGQLRETFDRNLTREQRLMARWKDTAPDLVAEPRRAALIEHLLRDGSINKSAYAELCGVSPATASKHLTMLADRRLLQQTGKGPSTRYLLST